MDPFPQFLRNTNDLQWRIIIITITIIMIIIVIIIITRGTLSASAGVSRIFLAVCYLHVMPSASPVFPLIENCGGFFFW